ncbi:phosphatidate cytidylyltransferase [Lichenihabitans sp. Uapishka_5]|uniref:phosphatidate cytidylyltransferase n=1 Tax=Lichenihabitans sp. Uapishka_5 TaxID=3037302 RepID=UPI0029E7CF38|nr:phosphatidate cytidylyltransferase [Lichenihabitans sp. Uapishka_5]MDX7952004.1 phosphatidate cytidylyltransferase [Lichenihabitans sp. Uapishka_5]
MTAEPGPTAMPAPRRRSIDFSDLLPRALSAIVLVAVAIGTAVTGGVAFSVLWWLAALAIHWEWQRLIGSGRDPGRLVLGALAIALAGIAAPYGFGGWSLLLLAVGGVAVALMGPGHRVASGFGVLYAGLLPLSLGLLRGSDSRGLEAVLWLFAVVWGTDIMAYFGGRLVGGPKLWRRVSPSKTWSGFLIGITSGALAGLAVASPWGTAWALLPLGACAGVVAQAGDLFESVMKRRFGAKDTGGLIPGHGGVMDRLDGFLAACAFAACFGLLRSGLGQSAVGLMQW